MQREMPRWVYPTLFVALVIGNIYVYQTIFAPPVVTVSVFKVGPADKQTSAVLIKSPRGKTVLVDTGPDASILRDLGTALPFWQRRLDAVVLTSDKKAFSGALPDILSRYHVTRTFSSGSSFSFDHVSLQILSAGNFTISYGTSVFKISSSTPSGTYTSDGNPVVQN
jgi:hypothetical protein